MDFKGERELIFAPQPRKWSAMLKQRTSKRESFQHRCFFTLSLTKNAFTVRCSAGWLGLKLKARCATPGGDKKPLELLKVAVVESN